MTEKADSPVAGFPQKVAAGERLAPPGPPRIRTADVPTYYANSALMIRSPYDLRIILGQIVPSEDYQVVVRDLADVLMSPQHFKAFVKVVVGQLAKYEADYGEIAIELAEDQTEEAESEEGGGEGSARD